MNYDKNVFIKPFYKYENIKEIQILPDNEENYECFFIEFSIGKLHFLDSFNFMSSSLDKLISNIPDDNKIFLKCLSTTDQQFEYMKKKVPYEWFDDAEKLKLPIQELKKEYFNNAMKLETLDDKEWNYIQQLIKDLDIKTFEEYLTIS